jgi:glutamyl-tRNA reductase
VALVHRQHIDEAELPSLQQAEVFREEKAYQFLLEVVSGLQSPMVAETEVFGQFKTFFDQALAERGSDWVFRPVMERLLADVKMIRQKHLEGLGGQSYGSLARKHLNDFRQVGIVGAGNLTREILPWFAKKDLGVRVYCRNPLKAGDLANEFPAVEVVDLITPTTFAEDALILAAPVSSEWFSQWQADHFPKLKAVLDLRGECTTDPLSSPNFLVTNLTEFFAQIEANRQSTEAAVASAHLEINNIMAQIGKAVRNRPFGWDDLCA